MTQQLCKACDYEKRMLGAIENLVNKLNVDLYTEVINWKEMRDLQISFLKSGVPHVDSPQDYAFFETMYNYANKYKIKTI